MDNHEKTPTNQLLDTMRKILTILILFVALSQITLGQGRKTYIPWLQSDNNVILQNLILNADSFRITSPEDGQILKRVSGKWINIAYNDSAFDNISVKDTLFIFSDTIIYITPGDSLVTKEYFDSLFATLAGGHSALTLHPSAVAGGLGFFGDPDNQVLSAANVSPTTSGYLTNTQYNALVNRLDSVHSDNTLSGYGRTTSLLKVDTTRIATKYYVDTSDDWGSQVAVTDATLTGNGTVLSPLKVDTTILGTRTWAGSIFVNYSDSTIKYVTPQQLRDSLGILAGGHDPVTLSSPGNGLSLLGQELSMGLATSGVTGALLNTDWAKFNSKMDSVVSDGTLLGYGTTINPLKVDTTLLATKTDVLNVSVGSVELAGHILGTGSAPITTTLQPAAITDQALATPIATNNLLFYDGTGLKKTRLDSLGRVSGLFSAGYLHGLPIATTPPASGQTLIYNGINWSPGSGASNWTVSGANIWRSSNVAVGGTGSLTAAAFSVDKSSFGSSGTAMIIRGASTVVTGLQINNGSSTSTERLLAMGPSGVSSYFEFLSNGRARFTRYGGSLMDGTVTKLLGVDANGYVYATPTGSGGGTPAGGDVYSNAGTYLDNQIPRLHGTSGDTLQTTSYPVIIQDDGRIEVSANTTSHSGRFFNFSTTGHGLEVMAGFTTLAQDIATFRTAALITMFQFRSSGRLTMNSYGTGTHTGTVARALGVTSVGDVVEFAPGNGDMLKSVYDSDDNGIFAPAQGGTGNQFFQVSGPASTVKTFTFPNASATVLTTNAAVTPAQGGTGIATYAAGDMLYAPSANTLTKLTIGANGTILSSDGTKPVWTSSSSAGGWTDNGITVNLTTATDDVGIGGNANSAYKVYVTGEASQSGLRSDVSHTTGYAGYFANSGTTGDSYGIYASSGSSAGYAGYFSGRLRSSGTLGGSELYIGSGSNFWRMTTITGGMEIGNSSSFGGASNGRLRIYNDSIRSLVPLNITGAVTSTSTFTGTNFILSSDKRLKAKIRPLSDLRWIDNVRFYNFHFKGDLSQRKRYGVIAQDIEKIAPEFVYENEKGILSVAYTDLIIAKVARQDEQIKDLQREVQELKKMVETLIKRK